MVQVFSPGYKEDYIIYEARTNISLLKDNGELDKEVIRK